VPEALVAARGVTVRFGGLVAVDNVDLEIKENELIGVIGPNGAGKTTLFHALSGMVEPTAGRLFVAEEDLTGRPAHVFANHGIARTFQTPRVFRGMTVEQNVRFGLEFAGRMRRHAHDAFDDSRSILGFLGLAGSADLPAGGLTPAKQRRLEIGMALGARPRVLLLDEVAAGLTEPEVDATAQLIRRVRDGIDLDAPPGKLTVVVGPNGAGKTTLLKALSGLIPRAGEVLFDGAPLPTAPAAIVSRGIALVPEGRQLFPQMTVRENLELGGYLISRAERMRRIEEVVALFPRLAERRAQLAGTMSGGEQQMLAVGRALMGRPRLLMLDEPSLGLAPKMLDELLAMVRRICDEGVTVLLVEQNVAKALAIAADAYIIERGRVVLKGAAAEVLRSDHLRAAYLGAHAIKETFAPSLLGEEGMMTPTSVADSAPS
jgi:branched-chain amino acid transport system ATP-binding protein